MKGDAIYSRRLTSRAIDKLSARVQQLEHQPVAWRWCIRNEIEPRIWNYVEAPIEPTDLVMVEALTATALPPRS